MKLVMLSTVSGFHTFLNEKVAKLIFMKNAIFLI
jgi:hypothetical protein